MKTPLGAFSNLLTLCGRAVIPILIALAAVSGAAQDKSSQKPASAPKATASPAATPPDDGDGTIRVKTDLVTLRLTVQDNYRRYVTGLTKNAFKIEDNGQPQDIIYFGDADAPVSVAILFDVSGSMSGMKIQTARIALDHFMATSHPSDEYTVIAFNSKPQLLIDRSRDDRAVLDSLRFIQPGHSTALYDAVYLAAVKLEMGAYRKKAIILISDGEDNSSRYSYNELRRLLKESDVAIYSIGVPSGYSSEGPGVLKQLSTISGGNAFEGVSVDIFERIALELRHQYYIGYLPKDFQPDGKWRKVKVKLTPPRGMPRLTVLNRNGYYATPGFDDH
ncbi:hypothetical protein BH10ACI2_BH10ACI2_13750 [soil metagenome]